MLDVMNTTQHKRLLAPERGEPQRSAGEPNGGADNRAADAAVADPEVLAQPKRRRFTAAYKARIVEEAQRCTEPGEIGALLRRGAILGTAYSFWMPADFDPVVISDGNPILGPDASLRSA